MELSIPAGVSTTLCGALPSRGSNVVPLSTAPPMLLLEKPSIREYSSPKPTQPDNKTIGDRRVSPKNSVEIVSSATILTLC